jgi:hypothetical protein
MTTRLVLLLVFAVLTSELGAQKPPALSFFVTSENPGGGGNLGGLDGADAYCRKLATAVGAGARTWRAYLSAAPAGKAVHARDRIGKGPWFNAKGVQIAASLDDLFGNANKISVENALDERGRRIPLDRHDMLTGSTTEGRLAPGPDTTCRNWTSSDAGSAMVGHHDKAGGPASWSSNHPTQGCSLALLRPSMGAGLFYCFAAN